MAHTAWNADLRSAPAVLRTAHVMTLLAQHGAHGWERRPAAGTRGAPHRARRDAPRPTWRVRLGTPTRSAPAVPRTAHVVTLLAQHGAYGWERRPPVGTRGAPHRARRNAPRPTWRARLGTPRSAPAVPRTAHVMTLLAQHGAHGLERRPPVGTRGAPHRARRDADLRGGSLLGADRNRGDVPVPASRGGRQRHVACGPSGRVPAGGRRSYRFLTAHLGEHKLLRAVANPPGHLGVPSASQHLAWTCAPTDGRDGGPVRESAPPSAQYRRRQHRGRPAKPQQSSTLEGTRR